MGETLRSRLARRLGLLSIGVLAVLGVGAVTAQAASPIAINETVPIQSVLGGSIPDLCNGDVITWTGNVHLVGGETTDAAGGAVFIGEVNFADVHGTGLTGASYTITLSNYEDIIYAPSSPTLPGPNIETHTLRLNINSNNGSPNFYEDGVLHYTVEPDGTVAVAFDKTAIGCSG